MQEFQITARKVVSNQLFCMYWSDATTPLWVLCLMYGRKHYVSELVLLCWCAGPQKHRESLYSSVLDTDAGLGWEGGSKLPSCAGGIATELLSSSWPCPGQKGPAARKWPILWPCRVGLTHSKVNLFTPRSADFREQYLSCRALEKPQLRPMIITPYISFKFFPSQPLTTTKSKTREQGKKGVEKKVLQTKQNLTEWNKPSNGTWPPARPNSTKKQTISVVGSHAQGTTESPLLGSGSLQVQLLKQPFGQHFGVPGRHTDTQSMGSTQPGLESPFSISGKSITAAPTPPCFFFFRQMNMFL